MVQNSIYQLIIQIIFSIVLTIGSVSVILFLTILIYGWHKFRDTPFYQIVLALAIVDCIHIILQWVQIYPSLFANTDSMPFYQWLENSIIGDYGLDSTDQALFLLVTLITLNRFAVFVARRLQCIFTKRAMPITIACTLLALPGIMLLRASAGYSKQFDHTQMMYTNSAADSGFIVFTVIILQYGLPVINLFLYVWIYYTIRKQRENTSQGLKSNDKSLLVQAFIEAALLEVMRCTDLLPQYNDDSLGAMLFNTIKTVSSVTNHSLNSIFFLTTNSTVQSVLMSMPCFKRLKKVKRASSASRPITILMKYPSGSE